MCFPEAYVAPKGFKHVQEACRNNFYQISCNMDSVVPSYGETTKEVNDPKVTATLMWG